MQQYKPSDDVVSHVQSVHFVGVVGPTAVGKSTIIERALERDPSLHLVLSTTSCAPRVGEEDGVDMYFRAKQDMQERIDQKEYATVVSLFDNYYATAPEDYSANGISAMPLAVDAIPMFRKLPFRDMKLVFILPPDFDTWQRRLFLRGIAEEQHAKRLAEAARSLKYAIKDEDILFVLNDDLDVAVEEFLLLVRGGTPDASQQEACRNLTVTLLRHLEEM